SAQISLSPQLQWNKYGHDIVIGVPRLDDRFIISSDDPIFPRFILTQTDLGDLIQKSFDLEGYFIRWLVDSPVIQVRMETMSSNSFIQAFNILLGTVGALSEKGYLTRIIGKKKKRKVHIPSYSPPLRDEKKPQTYLSESLAEYEKKPVHFKKQVELGQVDINNAREEISKPEEPIISWKPLPKVTTELEKPFEEESVENLNQPLFTSIQYQAKKIEYEPDRVRIVSFSRATEEIMVTFPEETRALFTTLVDRSPPAEFELQIAYQGQARQTNWNDAWKDIKILGPIDIVEKLQLRTGIAHRITSTGETKAIVNGHPDKKLECKIIVPKTIRGINAGYSLLKDIIWFFEMIFM
ncbi:MAG: hypothetical protein ACW991_07990, partial [Candidatus Hodarchaeales archaeon]